MPRNQLWGDKRVDFVDLTQLKKCARQPAAAFNKNIRKFAISQFAEQGVEPGVGVPRVAR